MKSEKIMDFSIFPDIEVRDKGFKISRRKPIGKISKFFDEKKCAGIHSFDSQTEVSRAEILRTFLRPLIFNTLL